MYCLFRISPNLEQHIISIYCGKIVCANNMDGELDRFLILENITHKPFATETHAPQELLRILELYAG